MIQPKNVNLHGYNSLDAEKMLPKYQSLDVGERGKSRLDGRIDLRRAHPDRINLQRTGPLAGHPWSALEHTRKRDAGALRFLQEQPVDNLDRNVTADYIAADQRDVAGL